MAATADRYGEILMPVFFIMLLLMSWPLEAKDNAEILEETTRLQEKALLDKYNIIVTPSLEKSCMEMARNMQFDKINSCNIINSNQINAYVLANGHVYFSLAMMQQINNKHQWAAILAHENAHLELNHYIKTLEKYQNPGLFFPKSKIKKMMRKHEIQADDWSDNRLQNYGYDAEQIYFFMQRVIKIKGNKKTNSHIQPSKRTKKNNNIELMDKKLIKSIAELD